MKLKSFLKKMNNYMNKLMRLFLKLKNNKKNKMRIHREYNHNINFKILDN